MSNLLHVADRVLNRPLLITRDKAQVVLSVLAGRIGVSAPDASRFEGEDEPQRDKDGNVITRTNGWGDRVPKMKPYKVSSGVAIISITGSLVNRGAWVGASSGLTSYEGIGYQLKTALADDGVHSVIIDLHSPGGEAVGAFETAALVRQLAAKKQTVALVNGMAASAAYAIASGASHIVTTETGVSGSIGVVLLHADFSRQLDREGITPTLIHAGAHKVDGNPFEPLSDDVRGDLQAEVNSFYDAFLACVAQGRGARLTVDKAKSTEAKTFIGKAAVEIGLADRVGSFESVLSDLSTRARSGRSTSLKPSGGKMSENQGAPDAETTGISQAQHDAALTSARIAAKAEGVTEANARLAAIFAADGVKGSAARMQAAADLAIKAPGMSAADVAGFVTGSVPAANSSLGNREHAANALDGNSPPAADAGKAGWAKARARHGLA